MRLLTDYIASRKIANSGRVEGYSNIYFETTENLVDMHRQIDFLDKDVLTVLASSDQVYTARYMGAKKVDSFDRNPLAIYYYYLRQWTIKYMNKVYPYPVEDNNYDWLEKLLSMVRVSTKEEANAYAFWKKHVEVKTRFDKLFYRDQPDGKVLFKSTQSIGGVVDYPMEFTCFDLFEENDLGKEYDIVMTSNILELNKGDTKKLEIAEENLSRLVKQGGLVLCSSLLARTDRAIEKEKRIFDSNFEYEDYGRGVGYSYRKR